MQKNLKKISCLLKTFLTQQKIVLVCVWCVCDKINIFFIEFSKKSSKAFPQFLSTRLYSRSVDVKVKNKLLWSWQKWKKLQKWQKMFFLNSKPEKLHEVVLKKESFYFFLLQNFSILQISLNSISKRVTSSHQDVTSKYKWRHNCNR